MNQNNEGLTEEEFCHYAGMPSPLFYENNGDSDDNLTRKQQETENE